MTARVSTLLDAFLMDPLPSVQTGAPADVALAVAQVMPGDVKGYAEATWAYRPLIARMLYVLAMHPVSTSSLEGSFSVSGWLDDARRARLRPALLEAQAFLSVNKEIVKEAMREVVHEYMHGKWARPDVPRFLRIEELLPAEGHWQPPAWEIGEIPETEEGRPA
jgi:hypothetical protein